MFGDLVLCSVPVFVFVFVSAYALILKLMGQGGVLGDPCGARTLDLEEDDLQNIDAGYGRSWDVGCECSVCCRGLLRSKNWKIPCPFIMDLIISIPVSSRAYAFS